MLNGVSLFIFWLALPLGVYSYLMYPMLLKVLLWVQDCQVTGPGNGQNVLPSVSLVITAYNEENRIRAKLENTLAIAYPADQFEIIIASDCSTDETDQIVREYADRGVKLARATERLGKEHAQECAIRVASGEILVFSDVSTQIPTEAIRNLVRYFSDPQVGAVSSEDRFISQDGRLMGEGVYVKYEMWLRRMESQLGGLVGLSGSFFAARRQVCERWDIHSPSDFNTALNCARLGLKAVTAPDVLGFYRDLKNPHREYHRKLRTVLRGITGLSRHLEVLNPLRFGLFAFQVWSHKLMRWLVPWFLLGLLAVSLAIYDRSWFYSAALWGQLAFYGFALAGHLSPRLRGWAAVRIVYFFVQVNVAIAQATVQFLTGRRMTTWQPSAR